MCFFFNDTATTEIYTLSLHDALPIWPDSPRRCRSFEPEPAKRQTTDRAERRAGRTGAGRSAKGEGCGTAIFRRVERGRDSRCAQGVGGDRYARLASGAGLVATANQGRGWFRRVESGAGLYQVKAAVATGFR